MSQDQTTPVEEAAEEQAAADAAQDTAEIKATPSPEVSALMAKIEEYKDGWQRERADFANYKRRIEREQSEVRSRGALDAITKLLPIIDDFERAMDSIPPEHGDSPWTKGITLLSSKLDKFLAEHSIEKIDPTGQLFDPNRHEAISVEEAAEDVESGQVTATLQKGYICGERVLRPARVRVAK